MNCSCPINKYWSMQNQKMPCGAVPKCNYDLDDLFWSAYTTWWQPRIHYYFQGSAACWNNRPGFLEKSDHHDYFIAIRLPHQFDYGSRSSSWRQFEIILLFKSAKTSFGIFLRLRRHDFFWMHFYHRIHIALFRKERLMLDDFLQ